MTHGAADVAEANHGHPPCGVASTDGLARVAVLFARADSHYKALPGCEVYDATRDARTYDGPWPVVAHPPCRAWATLRHHALPRPDERNLARLAVALVREFGGVLEHPAHSKAWGAFGLLKPTAGAGWQRADGYAVCYVEQGHYGHASRKPTWLLAAGVAELPDLNWTKGEQRLPAWMVERYGYEKARRIGVVAMVGGKNKTAIRNATPEPFRDVLISIARMAHNY